MLPLYKDPIINNSQQHQYRPLEENPQLDPAREKENAH